MNRANSVGRDPKAKALRELFEAKSAQITISLGEYHLDHLKRLYKAFDGDLLLPMILGEVGHFNLRSVNVLAAEMTKSIEKIRVQAESRQACNAYSISLALGLPRETVRRKVAKLIELGFLEQRGHRSLHVTDKAVRGFAPEFNLETFQRFLEFRDRIAVILAQCK